MLSEVFFSSTADQATVLVCLGQRNRPVTFSRQQGVSDVCVLTKAIRKVFHDVPFVQEDTDFILQVCIF